MQTEEKANENQKAVMQSLSHFFSDLCFDGEFRNHPEYLNEIFEYLLETEPGNSLPLRIKMLSCIRTSKMLVKALKPFSDQQIEDAFTAVKE